MKPRRLPLNGMNIVGANITRIRREKGMKGKDLLAKIQSRGMDITGSCLSKIKGQTREVTDKELLVTAASLGVDIYELFAPSPLFPPAAQTEKNLP